MLKKKSTLVLYYSNAPLSSFVFFGLLGVTNGLANVLGSSTWAEIYGVKYIGNTSIKNFNSTIRKFPKNIIASGFGFEKKVYFEADSGAENAPETIYE